MMRSGAERKNPPEKYGKWKNLHKCYNLWARSGTWETTFQVLLDDPDMIVGKVSLPFPRRDPSQPAQKPPSQNL